MTRSQAVAVTVVVAQAMIAYALTQPDVVLAPVAKFVLGCASVGLNAFALFLKIQPPVAEIKVPEGGKPIGGGE